MKPLIVLLTIFVIALVIFKLLTKQIEWKRSGRIAMCAMLIFTAIGHFVFPVGMSKIIPDIFPMKLELVYITGVLEILLAIGLLIPRFQKITGILLVLFFIGIIPANIKGAMENINYQTGELNGPGLEYLWFRIPLQVFFILWVVWTFNKKSKSVPH